MRKKIIAAVCISLIVLTVGMITTDYFRAQCDERPIFALHTSTLKDGGTEIYYGLCYKVISYNQLPSITGEENKDETVFGSWFLEYEK